MTAAVIFGLLVALLLTGMPVSIALGLTAGAAGAAGDVAVLPHLRAGADRHPGVDHGAFADIGA